jgi:predicted nucleotidyltransferase
MTLTRDTVFSTLALPENRDAIRRFGVRRLALFGSCARGDGNESSDLDFLVDLENKTFDAYMGLKEFLEDLFHCEVDLVLENTIKPRLRPYILSEAVDVPGL